MHEVVVAEGRDAHLEAEARDAAEGFVEAENFFGYGFRVADDEGSGWTSESFKLVAGDRGPAAFFADFGEGFGVAGEEVVGCLFVGVGYIAEGVDAYFELLGCVAGAFTGFAV